MQASCSMQMPAPCYGKYYVYSSSPALSHPDRHRKPKPQVKKSGSCFANHATNIRTRGAHEFYNMMWDPSVYRGNTTKSFYNAEIDRCKKRKEMDASVKRRRFPRKQKLVGGIERSLLSQVDQAEKYGLGDMGMQTEQFLEELTSDVAKKDMCTQIEEELNVKRESTGCVLRPFMIGNSQSIQTDCNLSYEFEENVRPIQKSLSRKILEQSLFETTEELELESLRKEKRKYIQIRSEELYRLKRAVDARRAVEEERAAALIRRQSEDILENEAESRLGAALFSAGCMGGLLPITFGVLKLEGYMPESGANDIYENLVPWMDEEVQKSYSGRKIVSRKLLDEMLQNVTNQREAEYALNQYWNSASTSNRRPSQNFSLTEDEHHEDFSQSSDRVGKIQGKSLSFMNYGYGYGEE